MGAGDRENKIELSYLTKQLCVIFKVSRETFIELDPDTLNNLVDRAKKKLEKEKVAGNIEKYALSPDSLVQVWPHLKQKLSESEPGAQYAIRFGFGIKSFPQVTVTSPDSDDAYCEVTIQAKPDEIRSWNTVALSSFIKNIVRQMGWSTGTPDQKSLQHACDHAIKHPGTPIEVLRTEPQMPLEIVKIQSATTITSQKPKEQAAKAAVVKTSHPTQAAIPAESIKVSVDPDGMAARVANFSVRFYNNTSITFDEAWIKSEVDRLGLAGVTEDFLDRIKQKLTRKQDINGLQLASGTIGTPGQGAYIAPVAAVEKKEGNGVIPTFVTCTRGAVVAEVLFRTPAVPGTDVYGMAIPPPPGDVIEAEIGEGIEQADATHFRATMDGLLKIEGKKISVLKIFVFQGDVTSNSGAIDFKGNMVISGNVEAGAKITVRGDVTIEGSVRGGAVICHGNMTVKGGVSTADKVAVHCDGEFKAGYIERATVYVKQNIVVENAILQSTIFCNGAVTLTGSEGRVGASTLFVWGDLTTTKIGFATGAPTMLHLGEDWKESRRLKTWQARLQSLKDRLEKDKSEDRTLQKLKKAQMTPKKVEFQAQLMKHMEKLEGIVKRFEHKLSLLNANRKLNPSAQLKTSFSTDGDVIVTVAGEAQNLAPVVAAS